MAKRGLLTVMAIACAISVLPACNKQKVDSGSEINSYIRGDLKNLKEVTPLEEYNICYSKYASWDEEGSVSRADLIAKVTLKSKKEFNMDTKDIPEIPPEMPELYYTVYNFSVDEVYYSKDNEIKELTSLKAFTDVNSYSWPKEVIEIDENEECIVFFTKAKVTPEDVAKSYEIADYVFTNASNLIFKKSKDGYDVPKNLELLVKDGVEISEDELEINPDIMDQKEILKREKREGSLLVKDEKALKKELKKIIKNVKGEKKE